MSEFNNTEYTIANFIEDDFPDLKFGLELALYFKTHPISVTDETYRLYNESPGTLIMNIFEYINSGVRKCTNSKLTTRISSKYIQHIDYEFRGAEFNKDHKFDDILPSSRYALISIFPCSFEQFLPKNPNKEFYNEELEKTLLYRSILLKMLNFVFSNFIKEMKERYNVYIADLSAQDNDFVLIYIDFDLTQDYNSDSD